MRENKLIDFIGVFTKVIIVVFVFALISGQKVNAQRDTTSGLSFQSWDSYNLAPRIGGAYQKNWSTELGISLQKFIFRNDIYGFRAPTWYVSGVWVPANDRDEWLWGARLGGERIKNGFVAGGEVTYYFSGKEEGIYLTPKAGLGVGIFNLLYGYNFAVYKHDWEKLGKHQLSLNISFNYFFHRKKV